MKDKYNIGSLIGDGGFGTVFTTKLKGVNNPTKFAVKRIDSSACAS